MNLDDPLQKYLPEGVTAPSRNGAAIKLLHLSNHTSSLPRMPDNFSPANPNNPFADYSEKQLYDFLKSYALPRDIGSQYEYSNYAAGLLGHIMATSAGKAYEALMIDVIADPLGMKDTRIAFTPEMKKNLAMGHSGGVQVENWDITTLAGAGAIRSTAVDLLKYVGANMGKVKSKLYPAMQLSHTNSRAADAIPVVGLGWHTTASDALEIIWHNGGTGGYRSFAGFIRGGNRGVVVLTNSTASADDIGMHLLNPKVPLTVAKPSEAVKEITVDAETLQAYAGKYELAPGFILEVSREDTQLKVQATGQQKFPVFAKSKNVFFYKVVEAQLTFNQNAEGLVETVTLHQGGRDIVGRRLKE
jgi:CubicO group peptidase (beta-lactamase class C family)